MLPEITLPNGRRSSALAFGCASLLRLPEVSEQQRLLDQAVDLGIRHFDVARLYGLGQAEAELGALLHRHPGQLTLASKCGLGDAAPPSAAVQRQGLARRVLQKAPWLRPLARRLHGQALVSRDFSAPHCSRSLTTSLQQLGVESLDLLLLHEPQPTDWLDPALEECLADLQQQGLIGGYGISGDLQASLGLIRDRPGLAPHVLQWEDSGLDPEPQELGDASRSRRLHGRFGRIRCSLPIIQRSFQAVPQLQRHWSDRLGLDLSETQALVAALLAASLAAHPADLLLFSTISTERLQRIMQLLQAPPWTVQELIAFDQFWRHTPVSRPAD